jgi:microcystin-dependent protein
MLNAFLGGNTLPDLRGTTKATLNQGTGRMSAGGLNGNTNFALGGTDTVTLTSSQIPDHNHTLNDPGHNHLLRTAVTSNGPNTLIAATQFSSASANPAGNTNTTTTGITINPTTGGGGSHAIVQPTTICGITMIRAA